MKKSSFTLFELIITITLIVIISTVAITKYEVDKLRLATNQILQHINMTRFFALSDNRFNHIKKDVWHRSRWTIKFMNCKSSVGGIYYVIYKDENFGGMPNKIECAKDPITKKYYYSNNDCSASEDELSNVLLTQEFEISKIEMSCNKTTSIGQISFGSFGEPYSKLSDNTYDHGLISDCFIKIYSKDMKSKTIKISANTGFAQILE